MKIVFLFIVFFHGIIHILGFLKAFGFSEKKELTLPISKPFGVVWLMTMILFLTYGLLYLVNFKYDWFLGIISVIISQIVIIYFWKDAKFGTLPNLVILIVLLISLVHF